MMFSRRSFILGAGAALAAPAIVKAESLMKIAVIREQALPFLPCDGRLVSRTTYARLFKVIGTIYGAGDGRTTFALPDYPYSGDLQYEIAAKASDPSSLFHVGDMAMTFSNYAIHLPN